MNLILGCYDSDKYYFGNSAGGALTSTAKDCQLKCEQTSKCNLFTFSTFGMCYLWETKIYERTQYGTISGPKYCESGGPNACPEGWKQIGDACYVFSNAGLNFEDAQAYCAEFEAKLVEPQSQEEDQAIFLGLDKSICKEAKTKGCYHYWIGVTGSSLNEKLAFVSSGDLVAFDIGWAQNEPNGSVGKDGKVCINEAGQGGWADSKCNKKKSVVCQKNL